MEDCPQGQLTGEGAQLPSTLCSPQASPTDAANRTSFQVYLARFQAAMACRYSVRMSSPPFVCHSFTS